MNAPSRFSALLAASSFRHDPGKRSVGREERFGCRRARLVFNAAFVRAPGGGGRRPSQRSIRGRSGRDLTAKSRRSTLRGGKGFSAKTCHVLFHPEFFGGKPILRGRPIDVEHMLWRLTAGGSS